MSDSVSASGSSAVSAASADTGLERSIDWKQGVIIAMGVPILILPSLYDLDGTLWAVMFAAAAAAFVLVLLSKERKEGADMIMPSEEGR